MTLEIGLGLLLAQVVCVMRDAYDFYRCSIANTLMRRIARAVDSNDQVTAVEILGPHIEIIAVGNIKTVREKTPGAKAIADLFSLDSFQAVLAFRDGWMPFPTLPDPFRWTKVHHVLGRLGLLAHPLCVGLLAAASGVGPRWSLLLGVGTFCLVVVALSLAGAAFDLNRATHSLFRSTARLYVARLGGEFQAAPLTDDNGGGTVQPSPES